jgi:hypothetical protein
MLCSAVVKLFKRQCIPQISMAAKGNIAGDLDVQYGGKCAAGIAVLFCARTTILPIVCVGYTIGIVGTASVLASDSRLCCASSETPAVGHLSHLEGSTLELAIDVGIDVDVDVDDV